MNVVFIGGGIGFFVFVRGFREFLIDIIVIVIVVDNGGSMGKIRDVMDILVFGDICNVIVVLSDLELILI